MLRGWKSASCSGFPALSAAVSVDVIEALGSLLAMKNIPMLSSQLLLPIPLMNPPFSFDRAPLWISFLRLAPSISFTFACQSGINLRVQLSIEANENVHGVL